MKTCYRCSYRYFQTLGVIKILSWSGSVVVVKKLEPMNPDRHKELWKIKQNTLNNKMLLWQQNQWNWGTQEENRAKAHSNAQLRWKWQETDYISGWDDGESVNTWAKWRSRTSEGVKDSLTEKLNWGRMNNDTKAHRETKNMKTSEKLNTGIT